jgi:vacuolar iron transporter family protein
VVANNQSIELDSDNDSTSKNKLNSLRASVLGANDGIVSVASIVLGVAGATNSRGTIFTAGLAGLVAGAMSMAVGEYVSVSSQRDSEQAFIVKEKQDLKQDPEKEFNELANAYQAKGLSAKTAQQVASELTKHDVLGAHLEVEMNLSEDDLVNPVIAAISSLISFTVGGIIPLLAIIIASQSTRLVVTAVAVLLALCVTGYGSAKVGKAPAMRAILRVLIGGALAMLITYSIGRLFGTIIH